MADPAPVHTFHASPAPPPTMRRYKRGRRQRSTSNGWLDVPGGCDLPAPAVPVPPPPVGGEMITLDFGNITRLIMLNSESKLVLDNLNITGKSLLPAAGQQRPGLAGAFRSVWASPARQAAPHHPLVPTRSLMVQRAMTPPPPPPRLRCACRGGVPGGWRALRDVADQRLPGVAHHRWRTRPHGGCARLLPWRPVAAASTGVWWMRRAGRAAPLAPTWGVGVCAQPP